MKLKEGMYAYSKHSRDYGIGKIVKIHTNGFTHLEVEIQYKDIKISTRYDYVIGSNESIDLLEVGDVLIYKHPAFEKEYVERIDGKECLELRKSFFEEKSLKLLAIVTKEQFESMSYKVN